jgi:hypothetical protein
LDGGQLQFGDDGSKMGGECNLEGSLSCELGESFIQDPASAKCQRPDWWKSTAVVAGGGSWAMPLPNTVAVKLPVTAGEGDVTHPTANCQCHLSMSTVNCQLPVTSLTSPSHGNYRQNVKIIAKKHQNYHQKTSKNRQKTSKYRQNDMCDRARCVIEPAA